MDEPLIGQSRAQQRARASATVALVLGALCTCTIGLVLLGDQGGAPLPAPSCETGVCLAPECMHALGGGLVGR
jgi:hypothetical protein